MLIRAEILREVGQRILGPRDHPLEIVFVARMVVDLDGDIPIRAFPHIALDGISRRYKRIDGGHWRIHPVLDATPPAFGAIALHVACRQRELISARTDLRAVVDEIRIASQSALLLPDLVVEIMHAWLVRQPIFLAIAVGGEFRTFIVAKARDQ